MFRALLLFPSSLSGNTKATMEAPLSVTLASPSGKDQTTYPDADLAIRAEDIFTTAVGHSSKRTLAGWHVTTPQEVIDHMLYLVGEKSLAGSATPISTESGSASEKSAL